MKRWITAAAIALAASTDVPLAQTDSLSDLDRMTFSCTKAGLNAAAREASSVASQGTYQFAYFKIINDSHHASYEVHFKSNYAGEADLKYCVEVYCQQGWDPKTKTSVTVMKNSCGHTPAPPKPRVKR